MHTSTSSYFVIFGTKPQWCLRCPLCAFEQQWLSKSIAPEACKALALPDGWLRTSSTLTPVLLCPRSSFALVRFLRSSPLAFLEHHPAFGMQCAKLRRSARIGACFFVLCLGAVVFMMGSVRSIFKSLPCSRRHM